MKTHKNKPDIPSPELAEVCELIGVSAVAARHVAEYFAATGENGLRLLQEGATKTAYENEIVLTVPTLSQTCRKMKKARIFDGYKVGRKFYVREGINFQKFMDYLEADFDYGTRTAGTFEEDMQRNHVFTILEEHGAIRANFIHNKIPNKAYSKLVEKMKLGELDIVFIEPHLPGGAKKDGSTHRFRFYNES